jgi:hypothetical protein
MKASCKHCGEKLVIARDASDARGARLDETDAQEQVYLPEAAKEFPSVSSMSPPYSKHRDALIFGGALIFLVALVAGGYFLLKGVNLPSRIFDKSPLTTLMNLILGPEAYEAAGAFLRTNQQQFPQLGRVLGFSPSRVGIRSVNGRKTAKVILRVQGTQGTKNVHFELWKEDGRWRVKTVLVEMGDGRYERVYPRSQSRPFKSSMYPNAAKVWNVAELRCLG